MNVPHFLRHRRTLAGFAALFFGVVSGCGQGPRAEFAWRDSTVELIAPAEKALKSEITARFGTPEDLVAWERMPVNYGGLTASVAAVPAPDQLQLALPEPEDAEVPPPPVWPVHPGDSVWWLTGDHAGDNVPNAVAAFDPKSLLLTLRSPVEPAPPEGTQLVAGFGSQLQLGRTVYMKNCLHCHGVSGDGNGPTAKYLNPRPRDFRLGVIKFTSTLPSDRARRDDIYRTISHGIAGTYMPSFLLMLEDEKQAVIEYVRWLSMRGELEMRLGNELADYNEPSIEKASQEAGAEYEAALKRNESPEKPVSVREAKSVAAKSFETYQTEEFPGIIDETADFIAEQWVKAEEESSVIVPKLARVEDTPDSRSRGRLLFLSNRTKCYTCHGPLGRGDGANVEDFWPRLDNPNEKYSERGLHDQWGNIIQPRDLTKGQYRGGRRPVDLYRRVYAGIKGTPMPAFGGSVLKDEEIWDLVNYVMSIPFEPGAPSLAKPATMASTEAKH
jgi:mono/diheme cytochrome c family protein